MVIDIDVGMGRTGCHDAEQAAAVARAIVAQPNLRLLGVQGYGGGWQHIEGANARASAAAAGHGQTHRRHRCDPRGGRPGRGGHGRRHRHLRGRTPPRGAERGAARLRIAFMDKEYRDALKSDSDGAFEQAATIVTTVISVNHPKWVTLDAGLKAFSTEGPMPQPLTPKFAAATYRFFGDEHGMISRPAGEATIRGERLALAPGHIDPTLDRYDLMHLVQGDVLVDIVRLEARGASQ